MTPDTLLFGITLAEWGQGLGTGAVVYAALMLVRRVLTRRLGALAARTANRWDDLIVLVVQRTHALTLFTVAVWSALTVLDTPDSVRHVIQIISVLVAAMQLGIWGNLIIAHVLDTKVSELQSTDPSSATTLNGVTMLARGLLVVILVLLTMANLGINISALVAGLGIGGVAIALATQNILGDLFASLSIVLDKPFVVGDFVVVGDLMGTVEHVGLKTTRLRSLSGEQLVFANADLLGSRIRNFKRMSERRVVFTIGVTYQTSASTLAGIPGQLREVVSGQDGVRFDRAHFKSCDDSALTFEVVYYVLDPDYNRFMDTQQQVLLAIVARFEEERIDFAYPTRTVYVRSADPESSGSATGLAQVA